jgi:hypothetical protein
LPTVAELAQQELSRRYSLQGRTQVAPRVQTMQNARPTVRSALSNLMRDAVDATGLEGGYRQGLLNAAGGVETAVDFLPVVGDVLGLEDASRAYGQGDMVGAGINMMGVVPVVGDVAAKGAKTARSALRNVIPVGHASPHRFEQFSMDKIGTGEGAQVYGHGLYFAENPTVVDEYFKQFNSPVLRFKEKNVDTPYTAELRDRFKDVYEGLIDDDLTQQWKLNVLDAASDAGLNTDEVADKLDVLIKNVFAGSETVRDFSFMKWDKLGIDPNEVYDLANNQLLLDNVLGGISQAKTMDDLQYVVESYSPDEMRLYKNLVEPELAEIRDSASRYDVNLNVSPEELLDWDAPYSKQPEKVKKVLDDILTLSGVESYIPKDTGSKVYLGVADSADLRGRDIYRIITDQMGRSPASASQELNASGVKGIKYFDGMSRNRGAGTSNYVMFDDTLINTKRVNDQLTPSWMNPEARMQRAQDLGFEEDIYYKGMYPYDYTKESGDYRGPEITEINRPEPFPAFNKGEEGVDIAGFLTKDPEVANRFAGSAGGGAVYPLRYRRGEVYTIDANGRNAGDLQFGESGQEFRDAVRSGNYDTIEIINTADEGDITISTKPENIRSINAEFDPTKADSTDLLSSVGATSALRGIV